MKKRNHFYLAIIVIALIAGSLFSDDAFSQSKNGIDPGLLKTMEWRELGPNRGGRSIAASGVKGDPMVYYFGGTGGGIWKTENGGMDWKPVLDNVGTGSVGDIAVSDSDPNVVFAGMGEHCLRGNISHGDGIYKSTDAGKTWENVGLKESRHVGKVIIHPDNPDVVYIGSLGHVYAPAGEFRGDHGVYRTKDGGKTWEQILEMPNAVTGVVDMTMDANNPRIMFAAAWEVFRTSYSLSSGGPGSGIYKTTDGGETWKRLEGGGLPKGILGRIGIAISPANSNIVYAMIEAEDGGMYRSTDGGMTWRLMNDQRNLRQRAWYYTHVTADPKNEDCVYVLNTGMYKSQDGGRTFGRIGRRIHGDHHALWINPDNPKNMIGANDGGANVSFDGGYAWTHSEHPTPQFYHIETDNEIPYNVYGAQQDNSTVKMSSRAFGKGEAFYYSVGGCECGFIVPDPRDHNIVYAGCYGGMITRYDHYTRTSQVINVWPDNPMGWAAGDLKYRFQWTAPIMISPHDPTKLYHAANVLFRSTDEGMSWTPVSPDLTRNDPSKMGPSGGPLTHDNTSVEYYCTIFALKESPISKGLIWLGTDDGLVHISRDDCATWTEITPKNMPEWSLISSIEPSRFDDKVAYIAVDRHELDDYMPYAYKTDNYGRSWKLINKGFPEGDFLRVIREDPKVQGLLYAGTEQGVYYSIDDGENWHPLQFNLPNTPIHDLSVKQDDLAAATHGRGFWILDDLTVLHQLRDAAAGNDMLLKPRDTWNGPQFRTIDINFNLADGAKDDFKLEILEADGDLIHSYTVGGDEKIKVAKGMNKFTWNRRYKGSTMVPGHPMWFASTQGPVAIPGTYRIRMANDGKTYEKDFVIKLNPNLTKSLGTTDAQLKEQFNLLITIRDKVTEIHETVLTIRSIKADLASMKKRVAGLPAEAAVSEKADAIAKSLSEVEAKMLQVKSKSPQDPLNFPIKVNNKIAALAGVVGNSYKNPTKQSYDVYNELSAEFDGYKREYDAIISAEIDAFNTMIRNENIPAIIIK